MDKITDIIRQDAQGIVERVNLAPLLNMRVVVTGATGLLGTYIMAVLNTWGKCSTIYPVASHDPKPDSAAYHFCWPHVFLKRDMATDRNPLPYFHYCFYGAGYGQPSQFCSHPLTTLAINTTGLQNALHSLNTENGRLLFASTSEIYSGHPKPPFHESFVGTTTPQHPRSCYIEGKRCGEAICSAFNLTYPNRAVAARIALAYGPGTRGDDGRVINQFIRQALLEGRIAPRDSGQVIRTYCYVSDAVELLLKIWLYGRHDVYNVGGRSKTTVAALAHKIAKICEVTAEIPAYADMQNDAPDNVSVNTARVEVEFNKIDEADYVSLDEGLRRTIEWQKVLYGKV